MKNVKRKLTVLLCCALLIVGCPCTMYASTADSISTQSITNYVAPYITVSLTKYYDSLSSIEQSIFLVKTSPEGYKYAGTLYLQSVDNYSNPEIKAFYYGTLYLVS